MTIAPAVKTGMVYYEMKRNFKKVSQKKQTLKETIGLYKI